MKPTESLGFGRGRQSLDRSVWYSGAIVHHRRMDDYEPSNALVA